MVFSNYWPVSLPLIFSTSIDRFMYNWLLKYISYNELSCNNQFRFQKGRSTHIALIMLIDAISEALENCDCVVEICLDFSKAFDTVDHIILLQKLYFDGIQDIILSWLENYCPAGNSMYHNGNKSNTEKIRCGVPHRCILGPLLLSAVSEAFMSILFADDTNMFLLGRI